MKKFFKIGCGCFIVLVVLLILLVVLLASCDSGSSAKDDGKTVQNGPIKLFSGTPEEARLLTWEKHCAKDFLEGSAAEYVKTYLTKNGFRKGCDEKSGLWCDYITINGRYSSKRAFKMFKLQMELKAFMLYLSHLADFINSNVNVNGDGKTDKIVRISDMKWGDIDFRYKEDVSEKTSGESAEKSLTREAALSRNGQTFITYTLRDGREAFSVKKVTIRGVAAYDELIKTFLKYNPNAVKLECSAWSWDEEKKHGEFVLALVLDFNSLKKSK